MKRTTAILANLILSLPLAAQWGSGEDTRRAEIRGRAGEWGKCTIEVEVDGVAEIEIREDVGRIRTLQGQPSTWRRFVCNTMMPRNPYEFRFRGIDGRGRQMLLREPGRNGIAVVRIEDPRSGREGYTFDLEWRGTTNWGGNGGGGGWGGGRGDWNRGGGWDDSLNFRGRGDGYFRDSWGSDTRLGECRVNVNRRGDVDVSFETDRRESLRLTGRVSRAERDRLWADMAGMGFSGVMIIDVENRTRVRSISMEGRGRNRFELRWSD